MMPLPFSIAWFGAAIAVAQIAFLALRRRRRYPAIPKRIPIGLGFDGRPRPAASKAWLLLAPAMLAAVVAIVVAAMVLDPVPEEKHLTMLFVFLVLAELAWLLEWTTDRQVELARGMTHRIAPSRMLLVMLPILATIGATIAVAITQSM